MFKSIKSAYKAWRYWDEVDECDMYNFEYQYDYQGPEGDLHPPKWLQTLRIWFRHLTHYKSKTSKWCYYRPWFMTAKKYTAFIRFAMGEARMRIQMWLCDKYGHKIVDDSSAGPDSGDMDYCCSRCGMSWHHQLY